MQDENSFKKCNIPVCEAKLVKVDINEMDRPSGSYPYSFDTDPDTIRIQGFDDKNWNKLTAEKKYKKFFDQKLQFTYP